MPRILWSLILLLCGVCSLPVQAQTREQKVRNDKEKVEAEGYWIYNDLPRAFAAAKQSGRPMIVVLRCLPCEECVKLDDEIIDGSERLKPLLDQFVRVRVVSTNGLDLSLFQFDTDQSFAVFLLNGDGTIYGRFGTRSHRTQWIGDVSLEGLAKAMEGALELHRLPVNQRKGLADKRGPRPPFDRPEQYAGFAGRYRSSLDYEGKVVQSCIHCHQIGDAIRELAVKDRGSLSDTVLFPFPNPKVIGLKLNAEERATVLSVEPDSAAAKSGLKKGDAIRSLNGQPLLSIADLQWVLHRADPAGTVLRADVVREGNTVLIEIQLAAGWRTRDEISWRASTWQFRRIALGGMLLVKLDDEEREKLQRLEDRMALKVEHVGQYAPHDFANRSGFRKGDIVLSFNDNDRLLRETDLIVYSLRQLKPGSKVPVEILRNGAKQTLQLQLP